MSTKRTSAKGRRFWYRRHEEHLSDSGVIIGHAPVLGEETPLDAAVNVAVPFEGAHPPSPMRHCRRGSWLLSSAFKGER